MRIVPKFTQRPKKLRNCLAKKRSASPKFVKSPCSKRIDFFLARAPVEKKEISLFHSWNLKVGTLLFQITNEKSYFETLAFARIIGYLCADGGIYYNKQQDAYRGVINLGHMIDVTNKSKHCNEKDCIVRATFNFAKESKAIYCAKHKKDDMINVIDKRCCHLGCVKQPSYNLTNLKKQNYII